jgi:TolB-like protein/ketosteroid isomerase-like protein
MVPRVTDDQQHPYSKMEGTDLVFAADLGEPRVVPSRGPAPTLPPEATPASAGNTIGVMQFNDLRGDTQNAWVGKALRVAFNTELSKVRALQVYSPELIDRVAHTRGADDLTVAQQLGIGKFLTGSFHVVGTTIRIDARIIDAGSGVQEGSDSVEGDQAQFFELQKRLVISMLRRLPVELSAEEGKSIQRETNTDVDAYRLLLETEGVVGDTAVPTPGRLPAPSPAPTERHTRRGAGIPTLAWALTRPAFAVEPGPTVEADVRAMLDAYRVALQDKDLDRLATLYVTFSQRQRDATRAYLQNAGDLVIEFSDISVTPHADGVAVSYTRRDRFTDGASGKPQRLEVRLTKILVNDNGHWKMAGGS